MYTLFLENKVVIGVWLPNALYSMNKALQLLRAMVVKPEITKIELFTNAAGIWDILLHRDNKGFYLSFEYKNKFKESFRIENMNLFIKLIEDATEFIHCESLFDDDLCDTDDDCSDISCSTCSF